ADDRGAPRDAHGDFPSASVAARARRILSEGRGEAHEGNAREGQRPDRQHEVRPMDSFVACLHDSSEKSCDEVVAVALFIKAVDPAHRQRHVGILYKDPDDAGAVVRELDLRDHLDVGSRAVRVGSGYFWGVPSVEPEIAYVLAKLCARIAAR